MYNILLFIHVIVCALLVVVVLLQQSRGGGMSSVFGGGGGTESLFGSKGATPFFVKLTTGLAIGFFATSLILVLMSKRARPQSAVEKGLEEMPAPVLPEEGTAPIPAEPGPIIPEEPVEGNE